MFKRVASCVLVSLSLAGCSFLPGFALFEQPALYILPVGEVANQVSCELQEFMAQHEALVRATESSSRHNPYMGPKWVLADQDASVKLTLQTDSSGYVNFTGVNAAQLGFASLQTFISSTTSGKLSVPTLNAKLSAKQTNQVTVAFSVSPKPLNRSPKEHKDSAKTQRCADWETTENPLQRLYLREWLNNYFETINFDRPRYPDAAGTTTLNDGMLRELRKAKPPPTLPEQFKLQSVQLTTTILIAADVSAGITPKVLGNGSVFIVPINGLSADISPDYSHKIDIVLNMCDNSNPVQSPCYRERSNRNGQIPFEILQQQCKKYTVLSAIMSGMKPPKDIDLPYKGAEQLNGEAATCGADGNYVVKVLPPAPRKPTT